MRAQIAAFLLVLEHFCLVISSPCSTCHYNDLQTSARRGDDEEVTDNALTHHLLAVERLRLLSKLDARPERAVQGQPTLAQRAYMHEMITYVERKLQLEQEELIMRAETALERDDDAETVEINVTPAVRVDSE